MQIAKIVRSGGLVSIELPAGFEVGEGEMAVTREGGSIHLRPISAVVAAEDQWAWLDQFCGPVPQEFLDALDEHEGDFERPDPFA